MGNAPKIRLMEAFNALKELAEALVPPGTSVSPCGPTRSRAS